MSIQKIFISGSVQSGKATFGYLFDGHPKILCNIIHDQLINSLKHLQLSCTTDLETKFKKDDEKYKKNIFCTSKKLNKKKEISIYDLRESLFKSNLHHLERLAFLKIYPYYFSRRDYQWLNFNFNYENFEKGWKNDIFNLSERKEFSLENIFDSIYKNLFIHWEDQTKIINETDLLDKVMVSKLPNDISSVELVLEEKFNAKIIYLERDLVGTLKSRTLNHLISRNINLSEFDKYFNIMIKSKFLSKLKKERQKIRELKNIYKDKIYISSLEKITFGRNDEMKKILDFCNLKHDEIVNRPTYLSENINSQSLDKINDDEHKISEKSEFFVNLIIDNKKYLSGISAKFYLKYYKQFLIYLYLKIRNWWAL